MRAGGEDNDDVHVGLRLYVFARFGDRGGEGEAAVRLPRDVHEEVERGRRLRRREAEFVEGGGKVVGTIVMVLDAAEQAVA